MQDTIDTKPYESLVAPRFDVDITSPLFKGIVEQPVDDAHHMGVVGFRGLELAEFEHLLEVGDR